MNFVSLTPDWIPVLEPWFDDADTRRYLGGREWLRRLPELIQRCPGVEVNGITSVARHVWIAVDATDTSANLPIGLVDVEPYSDGTAGFAFIVAPAMRGRGVGRHLLRALAERPELAQTHTLTGTVEPENAASLGCLAKAGFVIAAEVDEEGMLRVTKPLHTVRD